MNFKQKEKRQVLGSAAMKFKDTKTSVIVGEAEYLGKNDMRSYKPNYELVERRLSVTRFVAPKISAADRFKPKKDSSPSFGSYDV